MRQVMLFSKSWRRQHERIRKGCGLIRSQCRSGRGRGTRHAQGVRERGGGLRLRVPSSQDTKIPIATSPANTRLAATSERISFIIVTSVLYEAVR